MALAMDLWKDAFAQRLASYALPPATLPACLPMPAVPQSACLSLCAHALRGAAACNKSSLK